MNDDLPKRYKQNFIKTPFKVFGAINRIKRSRNSNRASTKPNPSLPPEQTVHTGAKHSQRGGK